MKKLVPLFAAIVIVVAASPASAHHPEVTASARCVDGAFSIDYTVEAWATDTPARRHNNGISVQVIQRNNPLVAMGGSLTAANGYRFSGTFTSLPQGHYIVRAVSSAWGPAGEYGSAGEYRDVLVVAEGPCGGEYNQRPLPTVAPPPSTTMPTTTLPVLEVVPVAPVVAPATVPAVPPPTVLAFTGPRSNALAAAGSLLLFVGLLITFRTRKSHV